MPKVCYITKRLSSDRMKMIGQANEIIEDYLAQGYSLTLRQLYYQFVSRGLIPNNQAEYKRLGDVVSDGRRTGLIDWEAIEDRTRNVRVPTTWRDPSEIIEACARQFKVDLWARQSRRCEVWVEKDALVGVLEVACQPYQVPYFSCRGYTSDSEVWGAAQRLNNWAERFGQEPVVLHLGDHDPSGIDMTRDIEDRLELFAGRRIKVNRLALNMDQVRRYNPPPNPAKTTDARFDKYQAKHGDESWELDALDPTTITALIHAEVEKLIHRPEWDRATKQQEKHRSCLRAVADRWDQITDSL